MSVFCSHILPFSLNPTVILTATIIHWVCDHFVSVDALSSGVIHLIHAVNCNAGPGGDLRVYLENLTVAEDVECYVRNNPFGQPFITQSDPHWSFYAQIAS
jgi:hypothetical protein